MASWPSAGCVVGVDYPKPIVDHATVHKINMGRMKAAYDRKLYGTPAHTEAGHPLAPALRQVGGGTGDETEGDKKRTVRNADLEPNQGTTKKSRIK